MRASLTFLVATLLLLVCPAGHAAAAEGPARLSETAADHLDLPLLGEILRATGKADPESLLRYESSFRKALAEIERRIGRSRSPYRVARRLHGILQDDYLRRYETNADGIDSILDRGEYNCVSASLFYGVVARAFGLGVEVLEVPRHVYVRLEAGTHVIDIESTSRMGFDLGRHQDSASNPRLVADPPDDGLGARAGGRGAPRPAAAELPRVVDMEKAVAFVWYNTGRRAMEAGDTMRAAVSFQEAARLQPEIASRSGALANLMASAFRTEYEAGRFESAYRIAEIGMATYPGTTSSRDRFLASATKWIDATCEAGHPAAAEEILNRTADSARVWGGQVRIDRAACPLIAAAAVRIGDWTRAARMAARYSAAEPDRIESARLARWVAAREREASRERGKIACADLEEDPLDVAFGPVFAGDPPAAPNAPGNSPSESATFGRASGREAAPEALE